MRQQIQFFLLLGTFLMVACWSCTQDDAWDDEYEMPGAGAASASSSVSSSMGGGMNGGGMGGGHRW